jgi:hypothetical protein
MSVASATARSRGWGATAALSAGHMCCGSLGRRRRSRAPAFVVVAPQLECPRLGLGCWVAFGRRI